MHWFWSRSHVFGSGGSLWINFLRARQQVSLGKQLGHGDLNKIRISQVLRPIGKNPFFYFRLQVDVLWGVVRYAFKLRFERGFHGEVLQDGNPARAGWGRCYHLKLSPLTADGLPPASLVVTEINLPN